MLLLKLSDQVIMLVGDLINALALCRPSHLVQFSPPRQGRTLPVKKHTHSKPLFLFFSTPFSWLSGVPLYNHRCPGTPINLAPNAALSYSDNSWNSSHKTTYFSLPDYINL
jgi:hypothetical protein